MGWTKSFMSSRLVLLDKQTGVRPVGVRETWRHIFSKIVIKVTGPEATMTCQHDQLCSGLKVGIDGAFHGVQDIWDENLTTVLNKKKGFAIFENLFY